MSKKMATIHFQKRITLAIYFLSCILIRLLFLHFLFAMAPFPFSLCWCMVFRPFHVFFFFLFSRFLWNVKPYPFHGYVYIVCLRCARPRWCDCVCACALAFFANAFKFILWGLDKRNIYCVQDRGHSSPKNLYMIWAAHMLTMLKYRSLL